MFERYTEQARQSILLATEESRTYHHDFVGLEHLLTALTLQPGTVAQRALAEMGFDAPLGRRLIGNLPASPSDPPHKPFTPAVKYALEMGLREALSLGCNYIGTEHVLLGIIRVERKEGMEHVLDGVVKLDALHDAVMSILGSSRRAERGPEVPRFVAVVRERHVLETAAAGETCACCGEAWPCADRRAADEALTAGLAFDAAEQMISDHILEAMRGIIALGLTVNKTELSIHVHGMQQFVIQHMLQRVGGEWSSWYEERS